MALRDILLSSEVREGIFSSERCRCGAEMKKARTALHDILLSSKVREGIFSSERCRCGADMKKPPMGST